jgi:adenosine deaminase
LPGGSLWKTSDAFDRVATPCAQDSAASPHLSSECTEFLRTSEKAHQQWELERRFAEFEAEF